MSKNTPLQARNSTITPLQIIEAAGCPAISIEKAAKLTGGLIAAKTIFNLCSDPKIKTPQKIKLGRRSGFVTSEFAEWFCNRLQAA